MNNNNYKSIVEAMLFASDSPLSLTKIGSVLKDLKLKEIREIIDELNRGYKENEHGFAIREVAAGYQMYTLPEYTFWVNQVLDHNKKQKLSQASLETLAIVAYKQPLIRMEIEHIRGVNCEGVLHTLLERNLITVVGREKRAGRPLLYGTTKEFLFHFGLKNLEDLPQVGELEAISAQQKKGEDLEIIERKEDGIEDQRSESLLVDEAPLN
ncbi:MAG: SMC-Scp complex subunit ScpB [Candidatus Zixiibacteriota bacterium]